MSKIVIELNEMELYLLIGLLNKRSSVLFGICSEQIFDDEWSIVCGLLRKLKERSDV